MKPIKHIKINKNMKVGELVDRMKDIGFQGRKIAEASKIFLEMIKDDDCKVFLGLAGAMVPGGMKQIIIDMLNGGYIDVLVTTGANLTHDLIEALGHQHYKGSANLDDKELREKKLDRIYNVLLKDEIYQDLEKFFNDNWDKIKECRTIKELLWKIGEIIDNDGILKICWEKKIPIFCPAISDSGIGLMIWGRKMQGREIVIDAFDDMKEIIDIAWTCTRSGVFYVGGGVPKNFIQQAMQFSNKQDGASYGVQITTDRPESGGSSGAPLCEGISWGKIDKQGKYVDVFCDATIALPLIWASVKDKLK